MNKLIVAFLAICWLFVGCTNDNLVDTNTSLENNNWTYAKSIKTTVEIKDTSKPYNVYFKLRHTSEYRYANLYVLFHLNGNGVDKNLRYQFTLATPTGNWLGKGSGDIFSFNFPLLTNYRFAKPGKYQLEIEQNMRDNPLVGISDIGLMVTSNTIK